MSDHVERKHNPDGSVTEIRTTSKTLPDGSVEKTTHTRTTGIPVNDVQTELKQGQLIDTHKESKKNPDGTTTETTVYTIKEGNVTKKITEVKTF